MTLYQKLKTYSETDYYGFHMPGHKRNQSFLSNELPYGQDITEIEGFDDLHHPQTILKEAQERAAKVYGAEETCFLVNGSTVGILSGILGNTKRGDHILVARNCHKSVYHGIELNGLIPHFLYPEYSQDLKLNTGITVSAVKAALKAHPDISAIVLVSPTYDGVLSDIKGISEAAHEKKIPLIVDEAHGAHFGFHPYFPENALSKGADVVIHSVHKTLPSLTQTALLHMQGNLVNKKRVRKYLDMLQSSSPSYILMASIDACIHFLETEKEKAFETYAKELHSLREALKGLKTIEVVEPKEVEYDPSKIVISSGKSGKSGKELYQILLEKYHLQMELAAGTYTLAMTSVGDTKEGLTRLKEALFEMDQQLEVSQEKEKNMLGKLPVGERVFTSEALEEWAESHPEKVGAGTFTDSVGKVSLEYAYLYPPGIPLIVPGERITEEIAETLCLYRKLGFSIEGLAGEDQIRYVEV